MDSFDARQEAPPGGYPSQLKKSPLLILSILAERTCFYYKPTVDSGYKVYIMTKSTKSSKATAVKAPETGSKSASATSNSVPTTQDGVMQAAITHFIRNDETVMQAIFDTVSNALVKKIFSNKSFIDTLSIKLMENGVFDGVKQSVYEANAMDTSRTYASVTAIESKLGDLSNNNKALSDEVDALEQYSRRNCLLLHGVPESSKDTTEAAITVFKDNLQLNITNELIDRSHRLGQPPAATDSDRPRPTSLNSRAKKHAVVFSLPSGN